MALHLASHVLPRPCERRALRCGAAKGFGKRPPPPPPPPPPLFAPPRQQLSSTAAPSDASAADSVPPVSFPGRVTLPPRRFTPPPPPPRVVASATALPAAVSDRILRRVLVFASPGAVLGLLSGPASYLLLQKEKAANVAAGVDVETFNPALLYSAGSVLFFLSAVGISYGILSASWDGVPGSLLGWAEAKNNVAALGERFGWTKKD